MALVFSGVVAQRSAASGRRRKTSLWLSHVKVLVELSADLAAALTAEPTV
jgi:hypothetical protein